jgi:transcriptional regulator with XRE-family HTH domain
MELESQAALAANVRRLMSEHALTETALAKRAGLSQKLINNTLHSRSVSKLDTVEKLARPFGLKAWHLLIPDVDFHSANNGQLGDLVSRFHELTPELQTAVSAIIGRHSRDR